MQHEIGKNWREFGNGIINVIHLYNAAYFNDAKTLLTTAYQ